VGHSSGCSRREERIERKNPGVTLLKSGHTRFKVKRGRGDTRNWISGWVKTGYKDKGSTSQRDKGNKKGGDGTEGSRRGTL